jgi:hypothetical protein
MLSVMIYKWTIMAINVQNVRSFVKIVCKKYAGHSTSHSIFFGRSQKCDSAGKGVCMIWTTWHVLVNVSIRWWYVYRTAHAFCEQVWGRPNLEIDIHKVEQCSYVKTAALCSRSAPEFCVQWHEALNDFVLPCQTVEMWVQEYGGVPTADMDYSE